LMNSPFVHEQSRAFARRLLARMESDQDRIRFAVESALGRSPSDDEVGDFLKFVERYREQAARSNVPAEQQAEHAWSALARVLLT
ncbi:DUF1553 domain-containing protein, partial [Vibrio cholerae]|uniref:DUF1553 domain-containing protein n=1 Tax=Vibrio cholerae TaxID=666 RepID=UPI00301B86BE